MDIVNVQGTGKDGRVLKEDVQKYAASTAPSPAVPPPHPPSSELSSTAGKDRTVQLSSIQSGMFKVMTSSLNIPHFLYTSTVDLSGVNKLRKAINGEMTQLSTEETKTKVTPLAFILKAVSLAFHDYPLLNSSLDVSDPSKLLIVYRASHNFGIAVDTPSGLLVPVLRNVQNHTIHTLAIEISRISSLARSGKMSPADFNGATFSVSNIGSFSGDVVAPIIAAPQVAILGVGRARLVPAFDENDNLVKKENAVFSWSADHRVIDGATAARCAEKVRAYLEEPGAMMVNMR